MTIKRVVMVYNRGKGTKKAAKVFNTVFDFNQYAFDNTGIVIYAQWAIYENI